MIHEAVEGRRGRGCLVGAAGPGVPFRRHPRKPDHDPRIAQSFAAFEGCVGVEDDSGSGELFAWFAWTSVADAMSEQGEPSLDGIEQGGFGGGPLARWTVRENLPERFDLGWSGRFAIDHFPKDNRGVARFGAGPLRGVGHLGSASSSVRRGRQARDQKAQSCVRFVISKLLE